MALPLHVFSPTPVVSDFFSPDDLVRGSLLVDYERGGVALNDPSQGLNVRDWEAQVVGTTIQVKPMESGPWVDVITVPGVSEIALSFDQNMRPTVAYVADGVAKMYWYDSFLAAYTTTTYVDAYSPVVCMDDKRDMQIGLNDLLLFYLRGGRVWFRQQRERFLNEYNLAAIPPEATRIRRWGMTKGMRIRLEFDR